MVIYYSFTTRCYEEYCIIDIDKFLSLIQSEMKKVV